VHIRQPNRRASGWSAKTWLNHTHDMKMAKDWSVVASKVGAPMIRVFSGRERPAGQNKSTHDTSRMGFP
jgi:hypothetical protein